MRSDGSSGSRWSRSSGKRSAMNSSSRTVMLAQIVWSCGSTWMPPFCGKYSWSVRTSISGSPRGTSTPRSRPKASFFRASSGFSGYSLSSWPSSQKGQSFMRTILIPFGCSAEASPSGAATSWSVSEWRISRGPSPSSPGIPSVWRERGISEDAKILPQPSQRRGSSEEMSSVSTSFSSQ